MSPRGNGPAIALSFLSLFLLLGCTGEAGPEGGELPPVVGKWVLDVPDSRRLALQEIENQVSDPRVAQALSRRLDVNFPNSTREAKSTFLEVRENGTFYWTKLDHAPGQAARATGSSWTGGTWS